MSNLIQALVIHDDNRELGVFQRSLSTGRAVTSSMAAHVAQMGYTILVRIPLGKWPLGRPRMAWKYDIKLMLRNICCDDDR
jgi:hypothetical protein